MCIRSGTAAVVSVVAPSSAEWTTGSLTSERLVYFVVSDDGVLVALYNDTRSAVVKLKNVSGDSYDDWHLIIRPEVGRSVGRSLRLRQ